MLWNVQHAARQIACVLVWSGLRLLTADSAVEVSGKYLLAKPPPPRYAPDIAQEAEPAAQVTVMQVLRFDQAGANGSGYGECKRP